MTDLKPCLLKLPVELVDRIDHQAQNERTSRVGLVQNMLEMALPLRTKLQSNSKELQTLINGAKLHETDH
jgi:metal-responsive CopG/Arc/MetJ family transcriptional regulator